MLVKLVRANSLNQVLDCAFNFVVLASKFLAFNGNPLFLHFYEFVKSVSLGFLGKINQNSLGESLQVVFNTVFHDVIDVDDQLFKFSQTLVNVVEIAVNVH
jgi:hypothetical protein